MEKEKYELKVGLFVIVGITILIFILFSIGDVNFYKPGYSLKARFSFINGLELGAPVRVAGVSVGKVDEISIVRDAKTSQTFVTVELRVDKHVAVEQDARFSVSTLGMFGEKYIEITPGSPQAPLLKNGDSVNGHDPMSMDRLVESLQELSSKAGTMMCSINDLMGDEKFRDDLKVTVGDMRKITVAANEVVQRLNRGEGTIGKLLKEDEIYNDLRDFVKDLKAHPWKLLHREK